MLCTLRKKYSRVIILKLVTEIIKDKITRKNDKFYFSSDKMYCMEIFLAFGTISFILYVFVQNKFSYWKKRNVPHTPPKFPFGSCQGISRTRNMGDILKLKYDEGKGNPYVGIYVLFGPGLLIRDPELVKFVLTKEFTTFSNRGFKINMKIDPLSGHLFFVDGHKWRNLRTKLTPTFTSGKMKMMFPIIEKCVEEMKCFLKKKEIVDVADVFKRYSTNVVTRCAYGIDVDFFENPDVMLEKMIDRVGNPTFLDALKRGLAFAVGQFTETLPFRLVPKDLSDYFVGLVEGVMLDREAKNIQRNDFMQLLIELKNKGFLADPDCDPSILEAKIPFTMSEAAAQAFNFLIGGFDTSSITMQFFCYELTINPGVQDKVRNEITAVLEKYNGEITYDALNEMKYFDQVLEETMRLHPIAPFLLRQSTKAVQLPNSPLVIEKGTKVWISLSGLQSDPVHFPQPEIFDPDRFSPDKSKIHSYTFMPFGEGPRACIGTRFAFMQLKTGLAKILAEFRMLPCELTPTPPLQSDPKKPLGAIVGGLPLKFVPL